jgi:hypothetical protein
VNNNPMTPKMKPLGAPAAPAASAKPNVANFVPRGLMPAARDRMAPVPVQGGAQARATQLAADSKMRAESHRKDVNARAGAMKPVKARP